MIFDYVSQVPQRKLTLSTRNRKLTFCGLKLFYCDVVPALVFKSVVGMKPDKLRMCSLIDPA